MLHATRAVQRRLPAFLRRAPNLPGPRADAVTKNGAHLNGMEAGAVTSLGHRLVAGA
eukprot:gene39067-47738_t